MVNRGISIRYALGQRSGQVVPGGGGGGGGGGDGILRGGPNLTSSNL